MNASLSFIQVHQSFWLDSARLELYPGERGCSWALTLYLMLSIRVKLPLFLERKKKEDREKEKPYLSSHSVSMASGSIIVSCQHDMAEAPHILNPQISHGYFVGFIFHLPSISSAIGPFSESAESLC